MQHTPGDWAAFLTNDENKTQLVRMLLQVWSSDRMAGRLKDRHVILVCDGKAFSLTSSDGMCTERSLLDESSQEETDSRVILYCMYGKERGYRYIRVKSPDSDIFFILLHYAQKLGDSTVLFDTGKGDKKRLIDISSLF